MCGEILRRFEPAAALAAVFKPSTEFRSHTLPVHSNAQDTAYPAQALDFTLDYVRFRELSKKVSLKLPEEVLPARTLRARTPKPASHAESRFEPKPHQKPCARRDLVLDAQTLSTATLEPPHETQPFPHVLIVLAEKYLDAGSTRFSAEIFSRA